jgi:hypothetical protein
VKRAARRCVAVSSGLALFLASASALADKVAVLPYSAATSATDKGALERARTATRAALLQRGHAQPTDSEMATAEAAVKDGVADTSDEYRAAAKASGSDWTVTGRVESATDGAGYRVELFAFQASSGRVESVARTVDPARADTQIGEMLALLLRPEGVGNAEIAWEKSPPVPGPAPVPAQVQTTPPPPPTEPEVKHVYAEGHPFAVGVGVGVLSALSRPANAQGTATSVVLNGAFGYALEQVPGLELRADIGGGVTGPRSLMLEGGARYAIMLAPTLRIYAGPEAGLGAFFTLGGDKGGRFFARGTAFAGIGLGERIQIEIVGDIAAAPGGAGALVLGGGGARGVVRF